MHEASTLSHGRGVQHALNLQRCSYSRQVYTHSDALNKNTCGLRCTLTHGAHDSTDAPTRKHAALWTFSSQQLLNRISALWFPPTESSKTPLLYLCQRSPSSARFACARRIELCVCVHSAKPCCFDHTPIVRECRGRGWAAAREQLCDEAGARPGGS